MTKTFCDRCGREIDPKIHAALRHRVHYAETWLWTLANDEITHVLCPSCEESLIYWFNHAETWVVREGRVLSM